MNAKTATFALLGLGTLVLGLMLIPSGDSDPIPPTGYPVSKELAKKPRENGAATAAASQSALNPQTQSSAGNAPSAQSASFVAGTDRRDRELRLAEFAAALAALPPDQALARIAQLPDQDSRDMAMVELLAEFSGASSLELIRRGDVWRFGAGGALAVYLLDSGKITAEQAASLARQSTDGNRRGELYARVGAKLASEDPAAAVAMGNGLEGWERQRFLEALASEWSAASPVEARRWIANVNDAQTRDAMLGGLLESEIRRDPAAAAGSLSAMPMSDEAARARATMRIASEWASKDTLAAMQWAGSLTDLAQRRSAEQGIRSSAPVGIGAMLTRGSDGLPVVGNIVPGSPAGASGALQAGDTLVAVTDASGQWIDTGKISQRELIGMVRGEPNTQVSLQVRSPGSSATRVVTLGRQQLIFRPEQN